MTTIPIETQIEFNVRERLGASKVILSRARDLRSGKVLWLNLRACVDGRWHHLGRAKTPAEMETLVATCQIPTI